MMVSGLSRSSPAGTSRTRTDRCCGSARVTEDERRLKDLRAFGNEERMAFEVFVSDCLGRIPEETTEKGWHIGTRRRAFRPRRAERAQTGLPIGTEVLRALGLDEDRNRNDEPDGGLHHPEPCLVETLVDVAHCSRSLFVFELHPESAEGQRLPPTRGVRGVS